MFPKKKLFSVLIGSSKNGVAFIVDHLLTECPPFPFSKSVTSLLVNGHTIIWYNLVISFVVFKRIIQKWRHTYLWHSYFSFVIRDFIHSNKISNRPWAESDAEHAQEVRWYFIEKAESENWEVKKKLRPICRKRLWTSRIRDGRKFFYCENQCWI